MNDESQEVENNKQNSKEKTLVDKILNIMIFLLFALVIILFILKTFFFGYYNVKGISMYPTFKEGDKIIAALIKDSTELKNDDVVTVKAGDIMIIKRLIGQPGDTIKIEDGKVYVNDELRKKDTFTRMSVNPFIYKLKEDEYFVLGDNREHSSDSREYGVFSRDDLEAVYHKKMVVE